MNTKQPPTKENPRQNPPTHSKHSNRFPRIYIKHVSLGDCSALISTLDTRFAATISNVGILDIYQPKTVGALGVCGWVFPTPKKLHSTMIGGSPFRVMVRKSRKPSILHNSLLDVVARYGCPYRVPYITGIM